NIVEQGAGLLNIEGAVRLAGALRKDVASAISLNTIKVGDPLMLSQMPAAVSTLDGQSFNWGGYIFAGGSHILAGADLFKRYQLIYNPAVVWVRDTVTISGSPSGNCQLITSNVIDGDVLAGTSSVFVTGTAISNGILAGSGIRFGKGIILNNGIILADG